MESEKAHILHSFWKKKSILRHLDAGEVAYLEEATEIRHYKRNEIVFLEGKRMMGSYVVLSGVVKQFRTGGEGRDYILRLAKPFELVGYRSALSDELACNTSTAIEDSSLFYIPTECLRRLVKTNGEFALDLLQIACGELQESHSLITDIAQKSVRQRLAELLLTLKNKFGVNDAGQIDISLTREELANVVGTATESVIRLLSEFKTERYIDVSGKRITILNERVLENIATL